MELIGEYGGYIVYKNKDGFLEGYLKKGKREVNGTNVGTGISHIVTECRTVEEFEQLVASNKKSSIKPTTPDHPTLF